MAGDWLKIEISTPDKPEVLRMARILKIDRDAVFGKLLRMWSWFDKNSVDGVVDGVVDADIDDMCKQPGFAAACVDVGWLIVDRDSEKVGIPKFDRHNGESAKNRALKNERQSRWRNKVDGVASTGPSTKQSTNASTREEKRREEKKEKHKDMACRPESVSEEVWGSFLKVRKAKNAPLTTIALKAIESEAVKAGLNLEAALTECCSRNWSGFKAKWLDGEPQSVKDFI